MGKVKLQESNLDLANLCKPMVHLRTTIYKLWMFQASVSLLENIRDDIRCVSRYNSGEERHVYCMRHKHFSRIKRYESSKFLRGMHLWPAPICCCNIDGMSEVRNCRCEVPFGPSWAQGIPDIPNYAGEVNNLPTPIKKIQEMHTGWTPNHPTPSKYSEALCCTPVHHSRRCTCRLPQCSPCGTGSVEGQIWSFNINQEFEYLKLSNLLNLLRWFSLCQCQSKAWASVWLDMCVMRNMCIFSLPLQIGHGVGMENPGKVDRLDSSNPKQKQALKGSSRAVCKFYLPTINIS